MITKTIKEYAYRIYEDEYRASGYNSYNDFCKKVWEDEKMRKYYCSMIIAELINNIDDIIWQQLSSTTYKDITQILKNIRDKILKDNEIK